jgi:hypothetical protein
MWSGEDTLEKFFRENKNKFGETNPPDNHFEKFLLKLNKRIRHVISIVPQLIRVLVVTVVIFAASITMWNNYIRKDRHEITLRSKISLVIMKIENLSRKE